MFFKSVHENHVFQKWDENYIVFFKVGMETRG